MQSRRHARTEGDDDAAEGEMISCHSRARVVMSLSHSISLGKRRMKAHYMCASPLSAGGASRNCDLRFFSCTFYNGFSHEEINDSQSLCILLFN